MQAPNLLLALILATVAAAQHEKSPNLGGFLAQPMAMVDDELPGVKSFCANYTKLYLQELQKFTLWAVQMYDSTAKVPEGVVSGNVYQFGHYDGCLKIRVDLGDGEGFRGKHCLAKIKFAPKPETYSQFFVPSEDPYRMEFAANESAWEKIKYTGDLRKQRRDEIYWGVCVPSVCNANSVANAVRNAIRPLQANFGIDANVELAESNCKVERPLTLDALDLSYGSLLASLIFLVLTCTAFDTYTAYTDKAWESFGMRVLRSFSIKKNWVTLTQGPASRDNDAGDLRSIHGIRFLSMLLIILGHRCMFSLGGPLFNPERIEEIYTSAANMILLNGTIIVDTFFLISGFLSCYLMLLELDKKKKVNVPLLYAYRYIRLTPVYAMVIGFYATIFVKLGDGPIWDQKVGLERDRCRDNWWTNILYINNYVNAENLCMFQSWFLTCDMHYFLLAPLIIYPLWRWPKHGKVLLTLITVLSVLVPFAVTLLGGLDAVLLLFMSTLADPVSNDTFRSMYIPTHTRAAPYIIGMVWGYVLYRIRIDGIKINKKFAAFIFIFLHFVAFGCIFGAWAFYIPDIHRSALEKALYGGLHRAGWALSIGWLIVATSLNLAGPYRALLSWKPMVPLGRLTYCAFLAHGGVQMYHASTMRVPEYMTYFKLFWMTLGDISLTFTIAIALFMLFEAPVTSLERIFFKKDHKPAGCNQQELPVTIVQSETRTTCRA